MSGSVISGLLNARSHDYGALQTELGSSSQGEGLSLLESGTLRPENSSVRGLNDWHRPSPIFHGTVAFSMLTGLAAAEFLALSAAAPFDPGAQELNGFEKSAALLAAVFGAICSTEELVGMYQATGQVATNMAKVKNLAKLGLVLAFGGATTYLASEVLDSGDDVAEVSAGRLGLGLTVTALAGMGFLRHIDRAFD